jgi:hypothetical protein
MVAKALPVPLTLPPKAASSEAKAGVEEGASEGILYEVVHQAIDPSSDAIGSHEDHVSSPALRLRSALGVSTGKGGQCAMLPGLLSVLQQASIAGVGSSVESVELVGVGGSVSAELFPRPRGSALGGAPGLIKVLAAEGRGRLIAEWRTRHPSDVSSEEGVSRVLCHREGSAASHGSDEHGRELRAGVTLGPVLQALSAGNLPKPTAAADFRLVPRPPGSLGSLVPEPVPLPKGSGQEGVSVRVRAVGLNFRDLLVVRGRAEECSDG